MEEYWKVTNKTIYCRDACLVPHSASCGGHPKYDENPETARQWGHGRPHGVPASETGR